MFHASEMNIFELKNLLPEPVQEKISGDRYGFRISISKWEILGTLPKDIKRRMEYGWQKLYFEITMQVAKMMLGHDYWYVLKFFPVVSEVFDSIVLELYCDIHVAQERQVVIPEFIYKTQKINSMPIEWRCGHCQSVNEMKERHCTQCGAPRTLLIQEMMK